MNKQPLWKQKVLISCYSSSNFFFVFLRDLQFFLFPTSEPINRSSQLQIKSALTEKKLSLFQIKRAVMIIFLTFFKLWICNCFSISYLSWTLYNQMPILYHPRLQVIVTSPYRCLVFLFCIFIFIIIVSIIPTNRKTVSPFHERSQNVKLIDDIEYIINSVFLTKYHSYNTKNFKLEFSNPTDPNHTLLPFMAVFKLKKKKERSCSVSFVICSNNKQRMTPNSIRSKHRIFLS